MIILLAGAFLAGDLALWNVSFKLTTVANANLLANLTPLTVIPLSYILFKDRVNKVFLVGTAICLAGVLVLMAGKLVPSLSNFAGDAMAFGTSFFYAAFMLTVYKLRQTIGSNVIMFISGFGTLAVLAIVIACTEEFQIPQTWQEVVLLMILALTSQILGQGLISYSLGGLNVTLASVITLLQPSNSGGVCLHYFS